MFFGAIGDLHGDFEALDRVMRKHSDVTFWLCPGDLPGEDGEYPRPRSPLYWIKGNNEEFDFVAAQPPGGGTLPNLHYIPNGIPVAVAGLTLAGLGGTHAPTWYETPAGELPSHPTRARSGAVRGGLASRDDKRRHFVRDDVRACAALKGIDVFLSHEAARPFPLPRVKDAGKTPINEVLAAMRPRLHLFGHHHRFTVGERQHVVSIGLEKVSDSYLVFDGETLAHHRMTI